jgi:hypothetical protein
VVRRGVARAPTRPVFEAHPQRRVSRTSQNGCVFAGNAITGAPFTNVMVYDSTFYGGGLARPGAIGPFDITVLERTPSAEPARTVRGWRRPTRRPGRGDPRARPHRALAALVHRTLRVRQPDRHHERLPGRRRTSATSPTSARRPNPAGSSGATPRTRSRSTGSPPAGCEDTQVAIHRSGMANYTLDRPARHRRPDGRAPRPRRPAEQPRDRGPARHRPRSVQPARRGLGPPDRPGLRPVQRDLDQSAAAAGRRGPRTRTTHVITPGASLTLHGVTIEVVGAAGDGLRGAGERHLPAVRAR